VPPWQRMLAVIAGGVFGALAWYLLRGLETRFITVEDSMKNADKDMPPLVTVVNGAIQDICVALGGSFGREAAPREIAAMLAGHLSKYLRVSETERQVLIACGTGAGLAAVYSVPISGTLYTLEKMLHWDMSPGAVIPAIVTSAVATAVSYDWVDTSGLYAMQPIHGKKASAQWPSVTCLAWAVWIGPIAGFAAECFKQLIANAERARPRGRFPCAFDTLHDGQRLFLDNPSSGQRQKVLVVSCSPIDIEVRFPGEEDTVVLDQESFEKARPQGRRDWQILVAMPAAFLILAILCVSKPSVLGNGRALAEVAIHGLYEPSVLYTLFWTKAFMTAFAIGAGASGGILSPSVALGATIGAVLAMCLPTEWSQGNLEEMAIISAAAFLSASMKCPFTGLFLVLEFAGQGVAMDAFTDLLPPTLDPSKLLESKLAMGMILPMAIAITGSMLTLKVISNCLIRAHGVSQGSSDAGSAVGGQFGGEAILVDLGPTNTKACVNSFRTGLLLNTALSTTVAAARPQAHDLVKWTGCVFGFGAAAVAGLVQWQLAWQRKEGRREMLLREQSGLDTNSYKKAFSAVGALSFGVVGAAVPMMPWLLDLYKDMEDDGLKLINSSLQCLLVSATCSFMAAMCLAGFEARPKASGNSASRLRRATTKVIVSQNAASVVIAMVLALVFGAACGAVIHHWM